MSVRKDLLKAVRGSKKKHWSEDPNEIEQLKRAAARSGRNPTLYEGVRDWSVVAGGAGALGGAGYALHESKKRRKK